MKRLIAVLLASVLALNLVACDPGDMTPEQIEVLSKALDGISDELENGDLEDRWEEFSENLHPEELELHWDRLTVEDYETLGLDMEQLQQAGLMIDEVGINKIDPSAINLSQLRLGDLNGLGQKNLEVLGYGGVTLADLQAWGVDLSSLDLTALGSNPEELISFFSNLSPEDLIKIGVNKIDLGKLGEQLALQFGFGEVDLSGLNLGEFDLRDLDPAILELVLLNLNGLDLSSLDLDGIDLNNFNFDDLDLSSLNLDGLDLSKLDPAVLELVLLDLAGVDLSAIDFGGLDLSDLDFGKLDLSAIDFSDIDFSAIDLSGLDLSGIDLGAIDFDIPDLDSLGLSEDDLEALYLGALEMSGVDLEAIGDEGLNLIGEYLDDIDLENIDLDDLNVNLDLDLSDLDLSDLDLSDLNLSDVDLSILDPEQIDWSRFDWSAVDPTQLNLDDLDLSDVDLSALDLSALPLEDLSVKDLEVLGIDDADLEALHLDELNLDDIDPSDFDLSEMTIGDLAAFGITVDDLTNAGLVPEDIAGDLGVLLSGFAEFQGTQSVAGTEKSAPAVEEKPAPAVEEKPAPAVEEKPAPATEEKKETVEEKEEKAEAEAAAEDTEEEKEEKKEEKAETAEDTKEEKQEEKTADAEEIEEEIGEAADADDGTITFLPAKKPDLKDDFYSAINYDMAKKVEIPAGYSRWNPIVQIECDTDAQISKIVNDAKKGLTSGEYDDPAYRIGALYETLLDMDARNEAGIEPIADWLEAYQDADDLDDMLEADLEYADEAFSSNILSFGIDKNPEDASHYVITIDSCMHGPNKQIMTGEGMDAYRDAYLVYLGEQFRGAGYDLVDSVLMGAAAYALQTDYEMHTLETQDLIDPEYTTNLFTREELVEKFDHLPIADLLDELELDEEDGYKTYQIYDLAAMEYLNDYYTEENFAMIKANTIQTLIGRYSSVLTEELYESARKFQNTVSGITDRMPFEEETVQMVNGMLPMEVGMCYVEDYCSEEAKEDVEGMVDEILDAYHVLIENNEWMDDETKENALKKLDAVEVMVAYPNRWDDPAEDAVILSTEDGGCAFENALWTQVATTQAYYRLAKGRAKRGRWDGIYPQTVNACYDQSQNAIIICAAIMQNTYYDPDAEFGTNLGGIGYVIAHELSHAFDASGAQYDAKGNVANWWTDASWKAFKERSGEVVDYYNDFVLIPGTDVCVNGALTVTENMADLGAMKAIEAVCDGDTEMFEQAAENTARCWASKINKDALILLMNTDVHAQYKARVNVPVQMCDLFYETFDVKEGDGMYVAPEDRIGIW